MSYLKPQSPLVSKEGDYIYPLTTVDQVVMEDGSRLNTKLDISSMVDITLTQEGVPADSKIVGDKITQLISEIEKVGLAADNALSKGGGTMRGNISMGDNRILHVANPQVATDAVNKGYVDNQKAVSTTATLSVSGWNSKTQTVSVTGVTASNNILVTAAPASFVAWSEAVVYCSAQGDNSLTFTCEEAPTVELIANILIMN